MNRWVSGPGRFWERGNPKHPPTPHPISKLPVTVEIDEVTRGTGKRRKRVIRLLVPN